MASIRSYAVALALLIVLGFPILRMASNIAGYNLLSFKVYALCLAGIVLLASAARTPWRQRARRG